MKKYQLCINGKWQGMTATARGALLNRSTDLIDAFLQTKSVWLSTAETVPNPFVIK